MFLLHRSVSPDDTLTLYLFYMSRMEYAERVLRVLRLLMQRRQTGVSLNELMRTFDVSRRTIYRDIEALKRAEFILDSYRDESGVRWILAQDQTSN